MSSDPPLKGIIQRTVPTPNPKLSIKKFSRTQIFSCKSARLFTLFMVPNSGFKRSQMEGNYRSLQVPIFHYQCFVCVAKILSVFLYHFEQIYYLRKEEPSISVSASKSSHGFTLSRSLNGATPNQILASPNLDDSSLVTGTIDGKFDDGYLITVNLGSEELKGVLYHIPTSRNTSQGVSISHDAAPGFHKKYHAHEKDIGDNIGKLCSSLPDAEKQVHQERCDYVSAHHV